MKRTITALAAVSLLLVAAGTARANIIATFSGAAGQLSGSDSFGHPWEWTTNQGNLNGWGTPGPGLGTLSWEGPEIFDFHIDFELPTDVVINTSLLQSSAGDSTVFWTSGDDVWMRVVQDSSVWFFAPTGGSLSPGEQFFVNVLFDGQDTSQGPVAYAFRAGYSVPEPASLAIWSLAGLALAGYGLRRRKHSP